MKISQVKISNFRSYQDEVTVDFCNLTAFVGKNDVGKSTILEALDIFFNENKGAVKLDREDINKKGLAKGDEDISITVIFEDLPASLIIDTSNETSLLDEYLLNKNKKLEIVKKYPKAKGEKVSVRARHPLNPECADLLLKKQKELLEILKKDSIACSDEKKNAVMRKAIWSHYSNELELGDVEIDVSKIDTKNLWVELKKYMPLYTLFQSDRKNSDGDNEIQDPMKLAVNEILKDDTIQQSLLSVATEVESKLKDVANRTLDKLNEINPEIANSLNPIIPSADSLKWADVFKSVSISGDEGIRINKRGSGVKRLILLNFFRAEAERRRNQANVPSIIYAIEEPETAQHPDHQKKLIDAFIELSNSPHNQIVLTTHSPAIVKMLKFENLKLVKSVGCEKIVNVEKHDLPYPSLNEVNFLAFSESDDGYHNELYGFIESENWLNDFKRGRPQKQYIVSDKKGASAKEWQVTLSQFIRHQIHHPENKLNERFLSGDLQQSISDMRNFIKEKQNL